MPNLNEQLRGNSGQVVNTHGKHIDTDTNVGRLHGGIPAQPKYVICKGNGEDVDVNAEYFVLRVDSDPDARAALWYYADRVRKVNEQLSDDLRTLLLQNGYSEVRQDGAVLDNVSAPNPNHAMSPGTIRVTDMTATQCGYCGKAGGFHMLECPTLKSTVTVKSSNANVWGSR